MAAVDRFISQVLREEGQELLTRQTAAIESSGLAVRSGSLLDHRFVSQSSSTLTLTHPVHERFLDIKKSRLKAARRKNYRIHNRFVYGTFATIADRLMNGYIEEIAENVRKSTV